MKGGTFLGLLPIGEVCTAQNTVVIPQVPLISKVVLFPVVVLQQRFWSRQCRNRGVSACTGVIQTVLHTVEFLQCSSCVGVYVPVVVQRQVPGFLRTLRSCSSWARMLTCPSFVQRQGAG